MEEMLEVMKKQLKMQKLICGLLAVMLVILLIAGGFFVNRMSQMTAAMSEAADKLQQVDVDGINENKPARRDCGAGLPRSSRRLRWWKNRCPRWL